MISLCACGNVKNDDNAIYRTTLDKYIYTIENLSDDNFEKFQNADLNPMLGYDNNLTLDEVYYGFADINEDNVNELIIYYKDSENTDVEPVFEKMIYDMYTVSDNKIIKVFSSMERDRYYLLQDDVILCEGSSSSEDSMIKYFTLGSDGKLNEHEEVINPQKVEIQTKSLSDYKNN